MFGSLDEVTNHKELPVRQFRVNRTLLGRPSDQMEVTPLLCFRPLCSRPSARTGNPQCRCRLGVFL